MTYHTVPSGHVGMTRASGRLVVRAGRRGRTGFTLIELLVVIAIISLLVSILLPSLNQAKLLARDVVCQSNFRNIHAGTILYSAEFGGVMPPHHHNWNAEQAKYTGSTYEYIEKGCFWGRLAPFIGRSPELWQCAASETELNPPPPESYTAPFLGVYSDYACNVNHATGSTTGEPDSSAAAIHPPYKSLDAYRQPAGIALLIDSANYRTRAYCPECDSSDFGPSDPTGHIETGIGFRHTNERAQMIAVGGNAMPSADFEEVLYNDSDLWGHSDTP